MARTVYHPGSGRAVLHIDDIESQFRCDILDEFLLENDSPAEGYSYKGPLPSLPLPNPPIFFLLFPYFFLFHTLPFLLPFLSSCYPLCLPCHPLLSHSYLARPPPFTSLKQLVDLRVRGRCKLPQRGRDPGQSPAGKWLYLHFDLKRKPSVCPLRQFWSHTF